MCFWYCSLFWLVLDIYCCTCSCVLRVCLFLYVFLSFVLEFDLFFSKLSVMCYLTVILFIVLRCVMLFLCLNLFRGLDWWCSVFSCLFVFEVCGSLLLLGFRVELVFSLCVSWFVVWILGCCSGGLVFLLFCLRHYCSYSLFLVLEFDFFLFEFVISSARWFLCWHFLCLFWCVVWILDSIPCSLFLNLVFLVESVIGVRVDPY